VSDQTPQVYSDHQRLDARSLALHKLIAAKLLSNPSLIDQARSTLARWRTQVAQPVPLYFGEWQRVLEGSPGAIAEFLVSPTQSAARLRQSSPFSNTLTSAEREKIYEAFR
jgi:hypothetical protein